MPLIRSRVTQWTCSDGQKYESLSDAAEHEKCVQLLALCERIFSGNQLRSGEDIYNVLHEHREAIRKLLTMSKTAAMREAKPANYGSDPRDLT